MLETSARRTPRALAWPLICVLATALLVAGCSEDTTTAPRPSPTPLADLNTTSMQVPRIEFCKLLPATAVSKALGGRPDSSTSYRNGDETDVADVGTEVVHEIGCTWSKDDGTAARAWVFARPVDDAFARQAIASSRKVDGCSLDRRTAFGDPSVTQTCRQPGGSTRVRHAGLFGQTWLTCEVSAPGIDLAALRQRADAWCVEVANALNTAG